MPNIATCSAKNEVFSALVRAVSVTQRFRAPFSTGCLVFGSIAASFGSLVSLPSLVRKRPICAYVFPPVASNEWIRMYEAKHFACAPVTIALSATLQVGRSAMTDAGSLASLASARIAVLFMSGEPTMNSRLTSLRTSLPPLTPITPAAMPNATSMVAATYPPISKTLRCVIAVPPSDSLLTTFKAGGDSVPSAARHRAVAAYYGAATPRSGRGTSCGKSLSRRRSGPDGRTPVDRHTPGHGSGSAGDPRRHPPGREHAAAAPAACRRRPGRARLLRGVVTAERLLAVPPLSGPPLGDPPGGPPARLGGGGGARRCALRR